MPGRVTTHVLDLMNGRPAAGMRVQLWRHAEDGVAELLRDVQTNRDGRVDQPLIAGEEMDPGRYAIIFAVADYFRSQGVQLPELSFLGDVPIHFGVAETEGHYHVPLLVTPWGYSTYRGS